MTLTFGRSLELTPAEQIHPEVYLHGFYIMCHIMLQFTVYINLLFTYLEYLCFICTCIGSSKSIFLFWIKKKLTHTHTQVTRLRSRKGQLEVSKVKLEQKIAFRPLPGQVGYFIFASL